MKYLVVKCTELGDQWECDADRKPLYMTDDISKIGKGYEIYEVQSNGSLKIIKEGWEALETGTCICWWGDDEDKPLKVEKLPHMNRNCITKSAIKKLKSTYHLTGSIEEIFLDIKNSGNYCECIKNDTQIISIGEYEDNDFPRGW